MCLFVIFNDFLIFFNLATFRNLAYILENESKTKNQIFMNDRLRKILDNEIQGSRILFIFSTQRISASN